MKAVVFSFIIMLAMLICSGFVGKQVYLNVKETFVTEEISLRDDPKLKKYPKIFEVDRSKLGFTPLPKTAKVKVSEKGNYVWLNIYGRTRRTICLKKENGVYKWVHEQEILEGPTKYTTVDGTFPEEITLTYETVSIASSKLNTLEISYRGNDPKLSKISKLRLRHVEPYLKKWGYRKTAKKSAEQK